MEASQLSGEHLEKIVRYIVLNEVTGAMHNRVGRIKIVMHGGLDHVLVILDVGIEDSPILENVRLDRDAFVQVLV